MKRSKKRYHRLSDAFIDTAAGRRKGFDKFFAAVTLLMFVATLYLRVISLHTLVPIGNGLYSFSSKEGVYNNYFVFANLMHAATIIMSLTAIILIVRQGYKYAPSITKDVRATLDERETGVRRKVFEKSYSFFFVGLILTLWLGLYKSFLNKNTFFAQGDQTFPVIALLLLLVSLPAIFAAFDKNS